MGRILLLLTIILYSSIILAQPKQEKKDQKEAAKEQKELEKSTRPILGDIKQAEMFINREDYRSARQELEAIINRRSKMAVAHRLLGLVHFEMSNYEKAISAYEASFDLNPKLSRAAYYECGEAYLRTGDIQKAHDNFLIYDWMKDERYANAKKEGDAELRYNRAIPVKLKNCMLLKDAVQNPVCEPPSSLGRAVNTVNDEYFPSLSSDGEWLLYTRRKDFVPESLEDINENIFISQREGDRWQAGSPIKGVINTKQNEGLAKFSYGKRRFFFAGCQRDDASRSCDIFLSELEKKGGYYVEELEGSLNSEDWDSQPCVSCDEKVLYFSSTRPGGYGGADIWVSYFRLGEWTPPVNLGPKINSPGDEEAPFIAPDGKTLYFSSDGHLGFGESDFFFCRMINGQWSELVHPGYPINSQFEEIGMFISPDGKTAYFSSDRIEGEGGLDLFEVELPLEYRPQPMMVLFGNVYDAAQEISVPATVNAMHNDHKYSVETNGNGYYSMCVPVAPSFAFHVDKEKYLMYVEATTIDQYQTVNAYQWDILLRPIVDQTIVMPPDSNRYIYEVKELFRFEAELANPENLVFYFNSGSSKLSKETKEKIKRISTVLQDNPQVRVLIMGYADDVGSEEYNKQLSFKRAAAVVTELKNLEVPDFQIVMEGVGEEVLDGLEKDRSHSRRVEVLLMK